MVNKDNFRKFSSFRIQDNFLMEDIQKLLVDIESTVLASKGEQLIIILRIW